jgi:hypothetical protein
MYLRTHLCGISLSAKASFNHKGYIEYVPSNVADGTRPTQPYTLIHLEAQQKSD